MKTDRLARPPIVGASVSGCRRVADVPRLPTLRPVYSLSVEPGCLRRHFTAFVTSQRHARQETHFVRLLHSLPRWQSAFSTPTRDDRRFLLDLSGGLRKWKRLRRSVFISRLKPFPDIFTKSGLANIILACPIRIPATFSAQGFALDCKLSGFLLAPSRYPAGTLVAQARLF